MRFLMLSLVLTLLSSPAPAHATSPVGPEGDASVGRWTRITPLIPRSGPTLVYDASRRIFVLFGGENEQGDAGTWFLSLREEARDWVALEPFGEPPTARYGHTAVLDPVGGRMLVYGGVDQNSRDHLGDLWELRLDGGTTWFRLSALGTGPSARSRHTAVLDPVGNRMIVFGGFDGSYLNDVWALSLGESAEWSQLFPDGEGPSPRMGAAAVYDPRSNRMILCGGLEETGVCTDTWELSLDGRTRWTKMEATGGPEFGRYGHVAALDQPERRLVAFGGYGEDGEPRNDVFELKLVPAEMKWREASVPAPPSPRGWSGGAYEPDDRRLFVFGGTGTDRLGDTWALSLRGKTKWTMVQPESGLPSARNSHSAILDPNRDRMIIYGGERSLNVADVWSLSLGESPRWTQLTGNAGPGPRSGHSAVYDPGRDQMLVFGGFRYVGEMHFNDLWSLSLGDIVWRRLNAAGIPPSPRFGHTAVYDPDLSRMIVFGGSIAYSDNYFSDLFTLQRGDTDFWQRVTPSGSGPDGRFAHFAVYDPGSRRMLLGGGYGIYNPGPTWGSYRNDMWALPSDANPAWANLYPNNGILGDAHSLYGSAYAFDPIRNRVVVFGGCCSLSDDVWAFSLETQKWILLRQPNAGPTPRFTCSGIMDTDRDRMVIFGGRGGGRHFNETWAVTWSADRPQLPDPVARRVEEYTFKVPGFGLKVSHNPTGSDPRILYSLPTAQRVRVDVFDVQGRRVTSLADEEQAAGEHVAVWRRTVKPVPPGIYFIRVSNGDASEVRRVIILN